MTAKEALLRVHELDKAVDAALAQIASYEADAERMTRIYGAAGGADGGKQAHDGAIVRLAAARQRCNAAVDEYTNYKALITDRINMLERADYIKILTHVYITKTPGGAPLNWTEIAAQMNYSVRQAQRIHGEALIAFRKFVPSDEDVAKCR